MEKHFQKRAFIRPISGNAAYGASGISHCMVSLLLPACAFANAIDQWIKPPVTPEKVLNILGKV